MIDFVLAHTDWYIYRIYSRGDICKEGVMERGMESRFISSRKFFNIKVSGEKNDLPTENDTNHFIVNLNFRYKTFFKKRFHHVLWFCMMFFFFFTVTGTFHCKAQIIINICSTVLFTLHILIINIRRDLKINIFNTLMGVLDTGSTQARPSARPSIDMSGIFLAHVFRGGRG